MDKKKKTNFNMKYIYAILVVVAVLFAAILLVPVAFMLMRILIGLCVLAVFGAGIWVGKQFSKNEKSKTS
jgi:uncharacterized membrane protein